MTTPTMDFETRCAALRQAYLKPSDQRPDTTVRGVHHLAMICRDVEQTIQFYQDVLGFPLVELFENRDYRGSTHFFFDIGSGNLLAFFDFPGLGLKPGVESIGSVQHVAISIEEDQFDTLKERLDARGIKYVGPDRGLSGSIYFKDPNGIQIELLNEPLREMGGRRMGG